MTVPGGPGVFKTDCVYLGSLLGHFGNGHLRRFTGKHKKIDCIFLKIVKIVF